MSARRLPLVLHAEHHSLDALPPLYACEVWRTRIAAVVRSLHHTADKQYVARLQACAILLHQPQPHAPIAALRILQVSIYTPRLRALLRQRNNSTQIRAFLPRPLRGIVLHTHIVAQKSHSPNSSYNADNEKCCVEEVALEPRRGENGYGHSHDKHEAHRAANHKGWQRSNTNQVADHDAGTQPQDRQNQGDIGLQRVQGFLKSFPFHRAKSNENLLNLWS